MAQFASDLILLGALPVVALALLTDGALAAAVARLEGRRR
jgi:ABC-type proline/glycine betaine transport system permease subunit